jgi:hypothetical protein
MIHVVRITKGRDVSDIPDSVDVLEAFTQDHGPGRYNIDQHSLDPFPGLNYVRRAQPRCRNAPRVA